MGWIHKFLPSVGVGLILVLMGGALSGADEDEILTALATIEKSPAGSRVLERARLHFGLPDHKSLRKIFSWGKVSKTDATISRSFDPETGQEKVERHTMIYLRQGLTLPSLILDVSHELTHASHTPQWDPYDADLTAVKYIHHAIEGEGGEVDAVTNECLVARDLKGVVPVSFDRCAPYFVGDFVTLDREKLKKDFFRVGDGIREIQGRLGGVDLAKKEFPLLSNDPVVLVSSTGRFSYPLSLIYEFDELTQLACQNSITRLENLNNLNVRMPASITQMTNRIELFIQKRCR